MENKQTAVEWLASELHGHLGPSNGPELLAILNQAKAMEKEQMIDFGNGCIEFSFTTIVSKLENSCAEQYYNETYGE